MNIYLLAGKNKDVKLLRFRIFFTESLTKLRKGVNIMIQNNRGVIMLKRFEVSNFKGFSDKVVLDLSAREYEFNKNLVVNSVVNKAIIYGKNGIGKSSIGIAIFDIIGHLTDKERMPAKYVSNYINLDTDEHLATFSYTFQFDDDVVVYEYAKRDPYNLIFEKLWINSSLVIDYNFFDERYRLIDKSVSGDLNIELVDNKLSVVKYIYRNTPTNTSIPITKMMQFIENMLWYRSLSDGNAYCGFTNGGSTLVDKLYEIGKIREFEAFLRENGLDYKLQFTNTNGTHELMAIYDDGKKKAPFVSLASTGTMALFLFFIWSSSAFDKISFLFIDEFDAFFHYESAENIVLQLNKARNFQTILTSHNTYLMQNKLTRPDCCFIMTKNKITNLFDSTDKEIREAHNLEKMYINGAFNEQ